MHNKRHSHNESTLNIKPNAFEGEHERLINNEDSFNSASYQEVFDGIGFGRWHILLLAQCGWANASDAIEIMCVSFTIDSLKDSLNITSTEATWLSVVLFLGMMCGGYLWGSLADSLGRRQVIMYSLAINGFFGAVSGFAQAYWLLLLLRFLSGLGAGGSLPVCFTYFSEFQPNNKRGAMISALATSWMAGNILAAGLAWLIIPSPNLAVISPYHQQWRFFILICAIPSLSSSVFFYLMPESPKFLMEKGRNKEAFKVLEKIFKFNNPHEKFTFSIIENDSRRNSLFGNRHYVLSVSFRMKFRNIRRICNALCGFFASIGYTIKYQFQTVFCSSSENTKNSLVLMGSTFSIALGGYGLTMWLPYLMQKMERNAGSICIPEVNSSTLTNNNSSDTKMYVDVFIGAAAQLPANLLTIIIVDRIGGKIVIVVGLILSGLSVLFLYLVSSKLQVILVNSAFNCVSTVVWNGLDVVTPEMYDTSVRAAATGLITALSRVASIVGNVIVGVFVESNCNIPLLTISAILLIGGLISILLPNTRQTNLR